MSRREAERKKESMEFEELKSQMATQSAQIMSLLGQVAKMMAQNKKTIPNDKG